MIQRGKIQVGNTILDGEIDIEDRIPEEPIVSFMRQGFDLIKETIISFSMVTPGYEEPNTVEGSITRPITDEGRLLK